MNNKLLISTIAAGCLMATGCIQANTDSSMLPYDIGNFTQPVAGHQNIKANSVLNSRAEYTIKDKGYELFMTFSENLNSAAFYVLSYTGKNSAAISNHYTLPPLTNTAGDTETPVIAEVSVSNDTVYLATGWENYLSDNRDYTYGLYTAKINPDGSLDNWTPATTLPISLDADKADKAYPIWFGTMPSTTGSHVATAIFIEQVGQGIDNAKAHYLVYQQTDGKWQLKEDFATDQSFAYPDDKYSAINNPTHIVQDTSTHQDALLILSGRALFSFVFDQDGTFQKALSVGLPSSDKAHSLKSLYSENWHPANGDIYLTDQNHGVYYTSADSVFSPNAPTWKHDALPQDADKTYFYRAAAPAPNSPVTTSLNVIRDLQDTSGSYTSELLNCIPPASGENWACTQYYGTTLMFGFTGEFLNIGQQTYLINGSHVYQYSRTSN